MYTKSDNIEIMIGNETDEIIKNRFESLFQKYQEGLEKSIKGNEFVFDNVNLLYYQFHKIRLNRGGSYIDSLEWLKNKKTTINPKNNDDKCFQHTAAIALNQEQIISTAERISNIKPFIAQNNWKEIDFPSSKKDWKKFVLINKSIALNILYVPYNTEEKRHAYKSKQNPKHENQIILLMITYGKKWKQIVAGNKLSALFRQITSKHDGDFYCLNCFYAYSTENKLKKHKSVYEDHDYCYVEMPKEDNKILKYKHGEKSMNVPFIIYADLESLSVHPLVIHCLQIAHLIQQKISLLLLRQKLYEKLLSRFKTACNKSNQL